MTDYSKIDFTKLKLDNVGIYPVYVTTLTPDQIGLFRSGQTVLVKSQDGEWRLTSWVPSLSKTETRELLSRSDQVDEFIAQQSRRRITALQLVKELVNRGGQAITIEHRGSMLTYRLNLSKCTIEYQLAGFDNWEDSACIGRHDDIVTVID